MSACGGSLHLAQGSQPDRQAVPGTGAVEPLQEAGDGEGPMGI